MSEALVRTFSKERVKEFFQILKGYGDIAAPVRVTEKTYRFQVIHAIEEAEFSYSRTMVPPKKYFIHPEEAIFTFNKEREEYTEPPNIDRAMVLLGVHACDINAMNLLARVFMKELPDRYYLERRRNSVIVGINCTPDEHCFCESTGTAFAQEGYELFLHDIGEKYLVRVGSLKGLNIVSSHPKLFLASTPDDIEVFKESERRRHDSFALKLEMSGLQELLDVSYDSAVWKEYGDRCLGCGSCNLVCPRCRCYDVQDYLNLDMNTGERIRTWYSCMLKEHGLVAGGHNFRPSPTERLRNRFNCKGSLREGLPNCVGCGRCSTFCPANIDFVEVMKKVRGDGQ